ncbi:Lysophospholipase L1 [Pseudarcicella hirudinis]|uniref:Lysophospholipase L1 n=1 Tax=Pseudarcicella hirudinis TaxID=1079859 RepID=A0A1I5SJ21_9BACT|nr:GDSL-type esterase/lipase family protein [Pseudarcicella hirudinis]SFP70780.1 Lysophospholipase L1 [Pseudarcicella hirudinis]
MFWYEEEVQRVEKEVAQLNYQPETIFYGSSSFTKWETLYSDFPEFKPVNLGFGGSTLAACTWYFDRLVAPIQSAKSIVIYAGDNDLGDGRHPEEIYFFYLQLICQIRKKFGAIPCYFISIKPSWKRWDINEQIKFTNYIIEREIGKNDNENYIDVYTSMLDKEGFPKNQLFGEDELHLSPEGYAIWKEILSKNILQPI